MDGLPLPEGYASRLDFYPRDVGRTPLQQPTGVSLVEQAKDYQFFTTVLLFAYGGLQHDPVREFVDVHGKQSDAFLYAYERPFLAGLPVDMCRILYGIPHAEWLELRDFMIHMSGVNKPTNQFYQVGAQVVRIADPVFLVKNTVIPSTGCPSLEITSFGLDGNFGQIGFASAKQLPLDYPMVRRYPARPEMVRLGAAVLSGAKHPFESVESTS